MAKWPAYGRCKSRLSKDIGKNYALKIQQKMLMHTLSVSKFLEREGHLDVTLAISGIGLGSSKRWCKKIGINNYNLQGRGNLGEKMRRQLLINESEQNEEKRDFIIIGTDLPDLCHLDLLEAISKLRENDIIFGPSEDGGYWLIGLSKKLVSRKLVHPFINLKWSSQDVLQNTIDNLSNLKLKIDFLNCKVDIDTIKNIEKRN